MLLKNYQKPKIIIIKTQEEVKETMVEVLEEEEMIAEEDVIGVRIDLEMIEIMDIDNPVIIEIAEIIEITETIEITEIIEIIETIEIAETDKMVRKI